MGGNPICVELFAAALYNWSQAVDDNRQSDVAFYSREIEVALRLLMADPACNQQLAPILGRLGIEQDQAQEVILAVFHAAERRRRAGGGSTNPSVIARLKRKREGAG